MATNAMAMASATTAAVAHQVVRTSACPPPNFDQRLLILLDFNRILLVEEIKKLNELKGTEGI